MEKGGCTTGRESSIFARRVRTNSAGASSHSCCIFARNAVISLSFRVYTHFVIYFNRGRTIFFLFFFFQFYFKATAQAFDIAQAQNYLQFGEGEGDIMTRNPRRFQIVLRI